MPYCKSLGGFPKVTLLERLLPYALIWRLTMKGAFAYRRPHLVAIVGGSGAGKTWLARQLQLRLGKEAGRLSLDDFYRDQSHLPAAKRAVLNFDHPRSVDWCAFEGALRQCEAGLPLELPKYDFESHTRSRRLGRWKPKPLVLVEGLWLLRRRALRRLFSFTIFLECAATTRLRRRLARDMAERGRSTQSVREQFAKQVCPMHERHVAPQARWADVVIRSPLRPARLDGLAEQMRRLLKEPPTGMKPARKGARRHRVNRPAVLRRWNDWNGTPNGE